MHHLEAVVAVVGSVEAAAAVAVHDVLTHPGSRMEGVPFEDDTLSSSLQMRGPEAQKLALDLAEDLFVLCPGSSRGKILYWSNSGQRNRWQLLGQPPSQEVPHTRKGGRDTGSSHPKRREGRGHHTRKGGRSLTPEKEGGTRGPTPTSQPGPHNIRSGGRL